MSESKTKLSVTYLGVLQGHNGWVNCLQCGTNKDNSPLLVSGGRDKTVIVWKLNLENPEEIKDAQGNVIERKVGVPAKSLHGHNHFVSALALSSNSQKLISASWDRTARLWDLASSKCQQIFTGHKKDLLSVAFSNDERLIFTGAMDKTMKYWNTIGQEKFTNAKFGGWINCLVKFSKGKEHFLAAGCTDGKVRIFNHDCSTCRVIPGGEYGVTSMCVSDEGDFLFVAYKDGTFKIIGIADNEHEQDSEKKSFDTKLDVNAIQYHKEHFAVVALGTSNGLVFKIANTGENIYEDKPIYENSKKKKTTYLPCIALTYDQSGKYLFAAYTNGEIKVYKIESGQ